MIPVFRSIRCAAATVGASAIAAGLLVPGLLAPVPAAADAAPQALAWGACDPIHGASPDTQCATLQVPRDYAEPNGPQISITISRIPATGAKRGVLVGNPGGPGGDGVSMFTASSPSTEIRQEWDLVAVQPRGLLGSTPVKCDRVDASDASGGAGALNRDRCEKNTPGYTKTLTTATNARDIEQVRRALGVDKVSLYGISYGTWLMSTYATLFPSHTDRLVLDSAMDPKRAWGQLLHDQTSGYKARAHAMMAWIADHDDVYHLGKTPLSVYQRWSAQVEREAGVPPSFSAPPARVGDVPAGLKTIAQQYIAGVNLTADARARIENLVATLTTGKVQATSPLLGMTRQVAPSRNYWPMVAQRMTGKSRQGKLPADVAEMVTNSQDMQSIMLCNEDWSAKDPFLAPAAMMQTLVTGDVFETAGLTFGSGIGCAGAAPVTTRIPLRNKLSVQPLQIQSIGDPQTPYRASMATRKAMGAHLITVGGGDHGQLGRSNKPLDAAIAQYLRTGRTSVTSVPQAPITTSLTQAP
ncbi:alpha/beta hydrolase [Gordonia sp. HY285]|uniref:alpha/beta fold hydrolase n=1 Tax=Gordonia liuliyuniae TaxID=2911517 RepID=UPI001F3154F0|nr:alpha/beta fold hydrolase [Gordonia liuliyuniae]MCF8609387.1 alpha/beta hydrolase [Gordonia liuliyuniae]